MRIRRPFALGSALGAIAHHGFRRGPGSGSSSSRELGRRGAYALWGALFPLMLLSAAREGSTNERLAAINSGIGAAGVAVHFAAWPWSLHKGVPMLDEAEGLTEEQLPAYNSVLWFWGVCSVLSLAHRGGPGSRRLGLIAGRSTSRPCCSPPATTSAGRANRPRSSPSAGARRCASERSPMSATLCLSFDNLGEAAEIELGAAPAGAPLAGHPTVTTALPAILAALGARGIAATFFVEGLNAELYPEALREIDAGGHEVAFHAWRHEQWGELGAADQAENLARGLAAFERIGLRAPAFARPAAGSALGGLRVLREAGLRYCSPAGQAAGVEGGSRCCPSSGATSTRACVLPDLGPAREPAEFLAFLEEELRGAGAGRRPADADPAPVHARVARRRATRRPAGRDRRRRREGRSPGVPAATRPPRPCSAGPDRGDRLAQGVAGVMVRHPVQPAASLRGVHQHRSAEGLDPGGLVGQPVGDQGERLGCSADCDPRRGHRVPAQLVGKLGDRQPAGAGEVVGARLADADHRGGERRGDVVLVDQLEGDARVGQNRPQGRRLAERPAQRAGDLLAERDQRNQVEQKGRVGAGDDAGAEDVGVGPRALQCLGKLGLDLGDLPRAWRAAWTVRSRTARAGPG